MKTKNLIFFVGILLLSFGCSNSDDSESDSDATLIGNKWKLVGFVDIANGTVKVPEPVSEDCYWLIFKDDNTLSGKSSTNYLGGSYDVDYKAATIHITNLGGTEINELFDGKLYIESLMAIQSFSVTDGNNELKFFYNNRKNYMLYKQVDAEDPSNNNEKVELKGNAYLFINSVPDEIMEKLQQERNESGIVAWMIYNNQTNSATLHILSQKENSTSVINNYPEYAKQWEVPSNGQKIYYRGDAIWTGEYLSVPPFVGYDLELTLLEKR